MSNITYSPKDVAISILNTDITGWDSITITREVENAGKSHSADGYLALTKNANQSGTLDIEIQQVNSFANAYLAEVQRYQDSNDDFTRFDIVITDKSGGVLCYLEQAFIDTPAAQDLGMEAGSRTWGFYVETVRYLPNPNGSEAAQSVLEGIAAAKSLQGFANNK